jgi:hypothetical protein
MATVCTRVTEWVESEVSRPIEEWEERQERKCKRRKWYDPRRWLCWLVTHLVKVIRWVLVTVLTAVFTLVCRFVGRIIGIFVDLLQSLWLFFKALVTWNKCTLQEALAELANSIFGALLLFGHVLIRPLTDRVQRYRLRGYVGEQIDQRFGGQPDVGQALKDLFGVDYGTFGYRLECRVYRMYVDSLTSTERYPDVPNLYGLHHDGLINLYELAGFDRDCSLFSEKGWYRPRPQTATYPFAAGGGGFGEPIPPTLSRDQLKAYIDSGGTAGPHFRIYAISPPNLTPRLDAMEEKGRQIGLILRPATDEIEVLHERYIHYSIGVQHRFLTEELGRTAETPQTAAAAFRELCSPVAVAVFGFSDRTERGQTTNLVGTSHCGTRNLPDGQTSGVSFIDDIPDEIRKYVLIHELGHYFGLCHADGFDRIMTTAKEGQASPWTKGALPYTFWHGGPRFTLGEGKQVWNFVLDNFPIECFGLRDQEPVIV